MSDLGVIVAATALLLAYWPYNGWLNTKVDELNHSIAVGYHRGTQLSEAERWHLLGAVWTKYELWRGMSWIFLGIGFLEIARSAPDTARVVYLYAYLALLAGVVILLGSWVIDRRRLVRLIREGEYGRLVGSGV